MTPELARQQLAPYGYGIDAEGRITRPDGVTIRSIIITHHRSKRWQVRAASDSKRLLWSGTDLGRFVADFYCAAKRA